MLAIEKSEDQSKAAEIYRRYCHLMLHIANSILHDPYLAEDAVSEAVIRIINNLEKIDLADRCRAGSFIAITVRNVAIDMLRQQARTQTFPFEDYIEYSNDDRDLILDRISSREACEKIAVCISNLHKSYSDILYLSLGRNYTSAEIGKMLNISRENVRMRLSRARNALKEQFQKKDPIHDR